MSYFVIRGREDGGSVQEFDKEGLLEFLKEEAKYNFEYKAVEKKPDTSEVCEWRNNMIIIKGDIVVPTPKKVVESFDVE